MLKILLAVDGSPSAVRATEKLVQTLDWYKEPPRIEVIAIHLPVPKLPNMSMVVTHEALARYYDEECQAMLAPSRQVLDAAGVQYTALTRVGSIAETIVEQSKSSSSDFIYMGTRGMTGFASMVLGSVAVKVLHLAHVPVVLVH